MKARSTALAIGATLLAAIVWGTSFNVNDIGLAHVGPGTFVFLRFAIAGVLCVGALALLRRARLHLLRAPWFWALAAANAAGFLLQYLGQTLTTPARTALFVNASAFAIALIERAVYKMPVGAKRALAIVTGFSGAAILIVGDDPGALRGGRLLGDLLTLASGLAWSVYFVMNDRAVEREDPVHLAAWTFLATAICLVPAIALDPLVGARPFAMGPVGAAASVYSGIVTTALAFGLWTYGLTRLRASASAILLLVEILVATLLSVALGRETFGYVELVGAALLVAAVVGTSVLATHEKG